MVAILSVTAGGSHVGLKSYMASICDKARIADRFIDVAYAAVHMLDLSPIWQAPAIRPRFIYRDVRPRA